MLKLVIVHYRPKTPAPICTAVTSSASAAPTVKAIFCSIMRRKIFKRQRFQFLAPSAYFHLQFHTLKLFRKRDSGSLAASGNFLAIPPIRAQKDFLRPASFSVFGCGAGGLRSCPSAFALARPFAFKPPFGFFPSARCHAGVFAITLSFRLGRLRLSRAFQSVFAGETRFPVRVLLPFCLWPRSGLPRSRSGRGNGL